MILRKYDMFSSRERVPTCTRQGLVAPSLLLALFWLSLLSPLAQAKDTHVTAIALFDAPNGAAYVQIGGLALNGKTELRICDGVARFDKRVYDGLLKTQLAGATALERGAEGALALTVNSKAVCVVPSNLKFEKNAEVTPAEAADQAILQGVVISSSLAGGGIPAFKPGVRLVFVATPDEELAAYLSAERANAVPAWQGFLARYGSSPHTVEARNSLAAIYEKAAEAAFAEYQKSVATHSADLAHLKQAQLQAEQAEKIVAGYPASRKLRDQVNKELDALLDPDRAKLQAFQKAVAEGIAGYAQLTAARQHSEKVLEVNPQYAPAVALNSYIGNEERKLDSSLTTAEGLLASKHYDEALVALGPYRSVAPEMPRVASVVSSVYASHFGRGQELVKTQMWEQAATEFRKAEAVRGDSKEAAAALKNAEMQLSAARNRQAADRALAASNSYAEKNQFIEAYETLANLPDSQQALVTDQLLALQKSYVAAAFRKAQKLEEIHLPIRGRADEEAVRQAYDLLDHASALSEDQGLKLKLDLLSDKIGAYYVEQAQRYLQKPMASGVGIGWLYLGEAEHYKPNLGAVQEAMARYAPAYQLRSRLSMGVVLRDQTSRRDSVGFGDQLRDAIVSGLESSGLPIKALRQFNESDAVQPNFLLIAEIREHRVVNNTSLDTVPSKYRAGTREVKSPAWLDANREYEAAQQQLSVAQRALADAQSQHKKKEITAAAGEAVAAVERQVAETRHKFETTEQMRTENVIEPYNYTKKNVDLTAAIDVAFRIADQLGNVIEPTVPIRNENHKLAVVLENVRPEDTEGVKKQSAEPDELQFLTDLEIQTRDSLVKSVREKALLLPEKILAEARGRAERGDLDGAAEQYVLYLNSMGDTTSRERVEATKFLLDHFNVSVAPASPATQSRLQTVR